ncbi:hypothetical protein NGTWS1803_08640 [Mycolicibacterium cyprinidarum]|nr:hypothetical protein NGTWS1803_08640 [Mycolicibacterium sp. NGTWS1803]
MTVLEWWYRLECRIVAPAELLGESFPTRIAGYDVTVYPPSAPVGDGIAAMSSLAPPRILGRPPAKPQENWGMVSVSTSERPVGVTVEQLAFTTEVADDADLEQIAETLVDAMDGWWETVRAWLEVVTGQHLTDVGHQEIRYIGNKTPIWPLLDDGAHGTPVSWTTTSEIRWPRRVPAVTAEILGDCVALADVEPKLAWTLLRDARSLAEVGQHRRAVIDAATAAELAVTAMLDDSLKSETAADAARLKKRASTLGQKVDLLDQRGHSFPQSFFDHLVYKRNDVVHEGQSVQPAECTAAIAASASVVETAFPFPTPPYATRTLKRLW